MKKNRFIRAYIITLLFVLALVITSQVLVHTTMSTSKYDSRTIALSSKQATLSQALTKEVFALNEATNKNQFKKSQDALKSRLIEFRENHDALKAGDPKFGLSPIKNTDEIMELYKQLEPFFINISDAVGSVLQLKFNDPKDRRHVIRKRSTIIASINSLYKYEKPFSRKMNDIIELYEKQAEEHKAGFTQSELAVVGALVALLLLQAIFVFRPAITLANKNFLAANTAFQKLKKSESEIRASAEKQLEINEKLILSQKELEDKNTKLQRSEKELLKSTQQQIQVNEKLIKAQKELSDSKDEIERNLETQKEINIKLEKAQESIRESEIRFRTVVENAPIAIFSINKDQVFDLVDGQGLESWGINSSNFVGQHLSEIETEFPSIAKDIKKAFTGHEVKSEAIHKENAFENHFVPLFNNSKEVVGIMGVSTDVTDRRKAQVELKEAYTKVKESEERIRLIAQEQLEATEKLMLAERRLKQALEEEKKSKDDLANAMDHLKNTQGQLVQQEKMASLGQLTAGIAHEINNPINFVYNGIDTLKMSIDELMTLLDKYDELEEEDVDFEEFRDDVLDLKDEVAYEELLEDIQELVSDVKTGAVRTMEIVKGLRVFSRLDEEERKPANLNDALDATLILLRNKTKNRVAIKKFYDKDLGEINCFPGQLNQVFMNILNNAVQAIPEERKDGELQLYTEDRDADVVVRLKDNGSGMSEDVMNRIFEPFFTTKPVGVGTGLGMSISFGIIEKHSGKISVNSEEGVGTEFVIQLPKNVAGVQKKEAQS